MKDFLPRPNLNRHARTAPALFSLRERQILAHVADGVAQADIARRLGITAATLRGHLRNIARKAGVRGVAQMTRLAVSLGLAGPL